MYNDSVMTNLQLQYNYDTAILVNSSPGLFHVATVTQSETKLITENLPSSEGNSTTETKKK